MPNQIEQEPRQQRPDNVSSVTKALHVLQLVAEAERGMTLSTVARKANMPITTAARLLKTLDQTEYLRRDADGAYYAGTTLMQMGARSLSRNSLYELAEPFLVKISEFTEETAYLAVAAGPGRAVYLRQVESPRAIRHASWTGRTIHTKGTAIGAALEERTGARGFTISRATAIEPEAAAVAVPILDRSGGVLAAISVIGPSFRLTDDQLRNFGLFIRTQVIELSNQLM